MSNLSDDERKHISALLESRRDMASKAPTETVPLSNIDSDRTVYQTVTRWADPNTYHLGQCHLTKHTTIQEKEQAQLPADATLCTACYDTFYE